MVVMADASQLKRSLYMLADFVGMKVPAILVPIRKKDYRVLYESIETSLTQKLKQVFFSL